MKNIKIKANNITVYSINNTKTALVLNQMLCKCENNIN